MLENPLQHAPAMIATIPSGVTNWGSGANGPFDKLNVKPGPHLAYSLVLVFFWFSVCFCLLRFSEYFPVIWVFTTAIHIRIHYHFSSLFLSVG